MFTSFRVSGRIAGLAAAGAIALAMATSGALAGQWPDTNANERDHVTNLLCVTAGCDVLRLPGTQCICRKENPAEQNLSRLKLSCFQSVGLRWEACPVRPPFGN